MKPAVQIKRFTSICKYHAIIFQVTGGDDAKR